MLGRLADLNGRFIVDGCGHVRVWLLHDLHLWTLIGGIMDKIVGKVKWMMGRPESPIKAHTGCVMSLGAMYSAFPTFYEPYKTPEGL